MEGVSKPIVIYELMSCDHSHNQYLFGLWRKHKGYVKTIYAPIGNLVESYAATIVGQGVGALTVVYRNRVLLIMMALIDVCRKNHKVVIAGCSTYFMVLLALIARDGTVEVHLHGQFYGIRQSKWKKVIWRWLSTKLELHLACSFYRDDVRVTIEEDILLLESHAVDTSSDQRTPGRRVGIIAGHGRLIWKGFDEKTVKSLERNGYEVIRYVSSGDPTKEWSDYRDFISQVDYFVLNPVNDYYQYSPSGTISDSINFKKPMLTFSSNNYVWTLRKLGCKGIIVLSNE